MSRRQQSKRRLIAKCRRCADRVRADLLGEGGLCRRCRSVVAWDASAPPR